MIYPNARKPWCILVFDSQHTDGRICMRFETEQGAKAEMFDRELGYD